MPFQEIGNANTQFRHFIPHHSTLHLKTHGGGKEVMLPVHSMSVVVGGIVCGLGSELCDGSEEGCAMNAKFSPRHISPSLDF